MRTAANLSNLSKYWKSECFGDPLSYWQIGYVVLSRCSSAQERVLQQVLYVLVGLPPPFCHDPETWLCLASRVFSLLLLPPSSKFP